MAKLTKEQSRNHRAAQSLLEKRRTDTRDEQDHPSLQLARGRGARQLAPRARSSRRSTWPTTSRSRFTGRRSSTCAPAPASRPSATGTSGDHDRPADITCVEINPAGVAIGRKLPPEANRICADLFDVCADPPCATSTASSAIRRSSRLMTDRKAPRYTGPEFELKIIDTRRASWHIRSLHPAAGLDAVPAISGAQYYQRVSTTRSSRSSSPRRASPSKPVAASTPRFIRTAWTSGERRAPRSPAVNFTPPVRAQGELFDLLSGEAASIGGASILWFVCALIPPRTKLSKIVRYLSQSEAVRRTARGTACTARCRHRSYPGLCQESLPAHQSQ